MSGASRTSDGETRREFPCGCVHFFAGRLGALSGRIPCARHDSSRALEPRRTAAVPGDWEALFLATYPEASARWPL